MAANMAHIPLCRNVVACMRPMWHMHGRDMGRIKEDIILSCAFNGLILFPLSGCPIYTYQFSLSYPMWDYCFICR